MISNEVKKIIQSVDVEGIDPTMVFSYALPKSLQSSISDKIVILINDVSNPPVVYGSNEVEYKKGTVQVQFFYPPSIDGDVTTLYEDPITKELRKNQWYQTVGGGVDREPTTYQLYTTYHFQKNIKQTI